MAETVSLPAQDGDSPRGIAFALAAYLLWGILPVYFKALEHVPTLEVLAHRILWSVPVALAVLIWLGRTADLRTALRSPRMLAMGALTAALVSLNWGFYVYAVQSGQTLEAALGYYINPLVTVLMGRLLLNERLDRLQWLSIALAGAAVVVLTVEAGRVPLLALTLTLTWALYAYFKKSLPLGPNQGFALEVILLAPLALAWLVWQMAAGQPAFVAGGLSTTVLLAGAGLVTAVPLMIYANGAKLLRLATIGVMQYITPTIVFLTAVFAFGEPFGTARAIAFPMIWAALALYTVALVRQARHRARERR